jgi:hypothetical protein
LTSRDALAKVEEMSEEFSVTLVSSRAASFLFKLASLVEEYGAEFCYTANDDGIHIFVDRRETYVGFLEGSVEESMNSLRAAAKHVEDTQTAYKAMPILQSRETQLAADLHTYYDVFIAGYPVGRYYHFGCVQDIVNLTRQYGGLWLVEFTRGAF